MAPLLYLHAAASLSELAVTSYGTHLLRFHPRLCPAWSPRPLSAALVGTSWAVIVIARLLVLAAINPWQNLGLIEVWEARVLWWARAVLCCRVGLLVERAQPPGGTDCRWVGDRVRGAGAGATTSARWVEGGGRRPAAGKDN